MGVGHLLLHPLHLNSTKHLYPLMAASNIENRKVDVVVRAAHGLKPPSGLLSSLPSIGGQPTPYLEVELSGSPTMKTDVNVQDAVNPVFDQKLVLDIIPATPDEAALMLHVRAYYKSAMAPITTALPLVPDEIVPDTLIGSGSAPLSQLFAVGHEDARVALTSPADGSPAGVAYIGVRMATPLEDQPIRTCLLFVFLYVFKGFFWTGTDPPRHVLQHTYTHTHSIGCWNCAWPSASPPRGACGKRNSLRSDDGPHRSDDAHHPFSCHWSCSSWWH